MNRIRRAAAGSAVVVLGLATAQLVAVTPAGATTTTRYVSPNGGGATCTKATPCELQSAITNSGPGDTVIMLPGDYPSPTTSYTETITNSTNVTLEGEPGKPAPLVTSNADGGGIEFAFGGNVEHLTLHYNGDGIGLEAADGTLNRVNVLAATTDPGAGFAACALSGLPSNPAYLTDSLCVQKSGGSSAVSIGANGGNLIGIVRNVTAVALGGGSAALDANETGAGSAELDTTNTIAWAPRGTDVISTSVVGGEASIHLAHSDFKTVLKTNGTIPLGTGNIHNKPGFKSVSGLNFHEVLNSHTVNAGGTTGVTKTSVDLDGHPRFVGSAPDMGAYELLQAPKIGTPAVEHGKSKHSIKTFAKVNPQGLKTSVMFVAILHGKQEATVFLNAGAGRKPVLMKATLKGLKAGTTYKLEAKAKSLAGTAKSTKSSSHTA